MISLLTPTVIDKHGPGYKDSDVYALCAKLIQVGIYFERRRKKLTKAVDEATAQVDETIEKLGFSIQKLTKTEGQLTDSAKSVSEKVRTSTQKLAEGLHRIEKQANFSKLEQYVVLLERAEAALTQLGRLEESGKLDRIIGALK